MDPVTVPVAVEAIASTLLHDIILFGIALFTAITAAFGAFKASQVGKLAQTQGEQITRLELTVDGRLSQLLELNKAASFAAGQKDEAAAGVARQDAATVATGTQTAHSPVAIVTEHVTTPEGNELVIRAEDAKVETDKKSGGEGDLIIKASQASVESKGKEK